MNIDRKERIIEQLLKQNKLLIQQNKKLNSKINKLDKKLNTITKKQKKDLDKNSKKIKKLEKENTKLRKSKRIEEAEKRFKSRIPSTKEKAISIKQRSKRVYLIEKIKNKEKLNTSDKITIGVRKYWDYVYWLKAMNPDYDYKYIRKQMRKARDNKVSWQEMGLRVSP